MKKFLIAILAAITLIASIPSEAKGGFGGGGRSSSSFSSSRSSSSFSAPAPRASAPAIASRPTGGVSSGGNVGMQRPAVTNAARTPTPTPTYGSGNRGSYGSSNNQSYSSHTTVVHHYSPSTGGGSFGMGSLAMAAMGGYMLNGIMHDSHGAVYNGAGYTNGVPTQGGQYYTQPQVGDVQQPQVVYVQQPPSNGWTVFFFWVLGISFVICFIAIIRRIFI